MTIASVPVLEMRGISKRFPGVVALDAMDLEVRDGEVHAIVGENGAGKSTLMKILSGAYARDAGEILFTGRPVAIDDPGAAIHAGIGVVYQDLPLVPTLTVLANVYLGRERSTALRTIDDRALRARFLRVCDDYGLFVDPDRRVADLGPADRQLVEILKVLDREARLIVLDEPTASLDRAAKAHLFATVRRLRSQGKSFILITHFIEEVFQVADRVTILKDGRRVATLDVPRTAPVEVVGLMIGHSPGDMFPGRSPVAPGRIVLEAVGIGSGGAFRDVNLALRESEIVGLTGLVGSGVTEVAHALVGDHALDAGSITLDGARPTRYTPHVAMSLGVSLLPNDRKRLGLLMAWGLTPNISLSSLRRFAPWNVIRSARERRNAEEFIQRLRIVTPSPEQRVRNLSGGNQQKVVLARMLSSRGRVLILDEPTQGIDVRAKEEIFHLIRGLADSGMAVLFISSEFKEVAGVADRSIVMKDGAVVAELTREQTSEAVLIGAATVSHREAA